MPAGRACAEVAARWCAASRSRSAAAAFCMARSWRSSPQAMRSAVFWSLATASCSAVAYEGTVECAPPQLCSLYAIMDLWEEFSLQTQTLI